MSTSEHKSKLTIEDILRLKRAERPSPEFWANFEQELREKQLTALVKKRRFWHELPLLLNRRFYIPAGATAIVAFTLVAARFSGPAQIAEKNIVASSVTVADASITMLEPIVVSSAEGSGARRFEASVDAGSQTRVTAHAQTPVVRASSAMVANNSRTSVPREADSTSPRLVVANFVSLDSSEPEFLNAALGGKLSSSMHGQTVEATSSGLAEMPPVVAKYRLIARYADSSLSPEPMAPALVRERLARRLGDDLGDSISRIGVVGSRVSLKF